MAEDEIFEAIRKNQRGSRDIDPEIVRRVEESQVLAGDIQERYRDIGVRLLSDEVPDRLDFPTRARLERLLGRDLSGVRVHTGERAQQAADALGAQAFALGERDVFFARDHYAPGTRKGIGLLAHEVAQATKAADVGAPQVGFKGAGIRGDGEAAAEDIENRVLAEEFSTEDGSGADTDDPPPGKKVSGDGKTKLYLDPAYLEREAYRRIRLDAVRSREHRGTF